MECLDILHEIFAVIDGATYKTVRLVCKAWLTASLQYVHYETTYCNHLVTLLMKRPDYPWDMRTVSANPNITWAVVTEILPELAWSEPGLSANPNMTLNILRDNNKLCMSSFCSNPNFTWDDISHSPTAQNIVDWTVVSRHHNITMDIIRQNKHQPWSWGYVVFNPNFTIDIVFEINYVAWDWTAISAHPNITIDIVRKHPECPWVMSRLTQNPSFTWDMLKTLSADISARDLSNNKTLTWAQVRDNISLDWDWNILSLMLVLPAEAFFYPGTKWNWRMLSANISLGHEVIVKYRTRWNMAMLSSNKCITWDFLCKHAWDWNMAGLCRNPNLHYKTAIRYVDAHGASYDIIRNTYSKPARCPDPDD
jgi:hypothetical protein